MECRRCKGLLHEVRTRRPTQIVALAMLTSKLVANRTNLLALGIDEIEGNAK